MVVYNDFNKSDKFRLETGEPPIRGLERFKSMIYVGLDYLWKTILVEAIVGLVLYAIYWFFHDCIGIEMNGFGEVVMFFIVGIAVLVFRIFK